MREVLPEIDRWLAAGRRVALATVVQAWGSAPRGLGATMAVSDADEVAGSVSGGCVEAAVIEACRTVLASGRSRLLAFGVTDQAAWQVGLACGGRIEVFVEPLAARLRERVGRAVAEEQPLVVARMIASAAGPGSSALYAGADAAVEGDWPGLTVAVADAARAALRAGRSQRLLLEGADVFLQVLVPAPTLIVAGGVHIAVALTALARTLGFHTVVVDPRPAFGSDARFGHVDRLLRTWPDEALSQLHLDASTAVAVLTHDPKLDDAALLAALPSPAFYVGALGSQSTQAKRRQRLLAAGLSEEQVGRLHAPIGLDLGGRSPEEIALAVLSQIVAVRNGRPAAAQGTSR